MPESNERWGQDLRLLSNLDRQIGRDRGADLSTLSSTAPVNVAISADRPVDLATLTADDNLKQALLLRFLTPFGELASLGHPTYGSRLYTLIGELNNDVNRNRAKVYVLQALAAEPRVQEVQSVRVTTNASDRTRIDIDISLIPIHSDTPLNLVFPFFLE
ncbi:GPW/gp25 family protein [Oscillatoria sp. CS-180]|uniref:GPW/gp25 family protein n=1 Tax=Oscillatoria sp. CS-180 TaxID=3021720 RepID=UPI00232E7245|nr:GPW/gp25 family protein [Oscillatoria sp. CS-180]MDB9527108.1 GPW/gp25 family protein [Oscillatoria sp. CS-180]